MKMVFVLLLLVAMATSVLGGCGADDQLRYDPPHTYQQDK
jgi:hypothetical protein